MPCCFTALDCDGRDPCARAAGTDVGQVTVRSLGNRTYEFDTGNIKATATADAEGRLIRLTVPDAKVVVER